MTIAITLVDTAIYLLILTLVSPLVALMWQVARGAIGFLFPDWIIKEAMEPPLLAKTVVNTLAGLLTVIATFMYGWHYGVANVLIGVIALIIHYPRVKRLKEEMERVNLQNSMYRNE